MYSWCPSQIVLLRVIQPISVWSKTSLKLEELEGGDIFINILQLNNFESWLLVKRDPKKINDLLKEWLEVMTARPMEKEVPFHLSFFFSGEFFAQKSRERLVFVRLHLSFMDEANKGLKHELWHRFNAHWCHLDRQIRFISILSLLLFPSFAHFISLFFLLFQQIVWSFLFLSFFSLPLS